MDGTPLADFEEEYVYAFMEFIVLAIAEYRNYESAIGYTFRFYLQDMVGSEQVKMLLIDGAAPDIEHIADGSYPFISEIVAVTVESRSANSSVSEKDLQDRLEREENTKKLLEWITSAEGQTLVERTGYVPVG